MTKTTSSSHPLSYLFINPVIWAKINHEALKEAVKKAGYTLVYTEHDHIQDIQNDYANLRKKTQLPILDIRCPAAVEEALKHQPQGLMVPEFYPILIRSALELYERYIKHSLASLTVITPCQSLKNLGNSLQKPRLIFRTWRELKEIHSLLLKEKELANSPIPPNFFKIKDKVVLDGQKEIAHYFKQAHRDTIIEMLFCDQGCHHGDGV